MSQDVKFIRVRGRVVPVRNGADKGPSKKKAGSKVTRKDISAAHKEAVKHTRISTKDKVGIKARNGVLGFGAGGFAGASLGLAAATIANVATRGRTGKYSADIFLAGAAGGAVLGGLAGASTSTKGLARDRQFNKALKKQMAKKNKSGV